MAESIAQWIIDTLGGSVPGEFIVFLISLLPVLELRGGLIAASLLGINWMPAYIICFIGNMLPIPFILLFIRKIFEWLKKRKAFAGLVNKLEAKAEKKSDTIKKYRLLGLFLFVAIPLPGTGAWTGALIAALLDIRVKHALPVICLGVISAGIIMSLISYTIPHLISTFF